MDNRWPSKKLTIYGSQNFVIGTLKLTVICTTLVLVFKMLSYFSVMGYVPPNKCITKDWEKRRLSEYLWYSSVDHVWKDLSDDVTIVTGYLNIGAFCKGSCAEIRTNATYINWMQNYAYISNPVVAYFDSEMVAKTFKSIRGNAPSRVHMVKLEHLWSFSNIALIKCIFENSGQVKHYPNTVVPEYACAVSAKYEFMSHTLLENPFNTRYMAWADIGYFREAEETQFGIWLPEGFDPEKVGITEVYQRFEDITAEQIFQHNVDWIASGFWIAHINVMRMWVDHFQRTVEILLDSQLMGADQQVLYTMLNWKNSTVDIQVFRQPSDSVGNSWFYISKLCRESWTQKNMLNMLNFVMA